MIARIEPAAIVGTHMERHISITCNFMAGQLIDQLLPFARHACSQYARLVDGSVSLLLLGHCAGINLDH